MIKSIITGYVGSDATVNDNGTCRFSIASTEKGYTNKEGVVIPDKTTWITVFKHNGRNIAPYIKKSIYLVVDTKNITANVHEGKASLQCNAIEIEFGGNNN